MCVFCMIFMCMVVMKVYVEVMDWKFVEVLFEDMRRDGSASNDYMYSVMLYVYEKSL